MANQLGGLAKKAAYLLQHKAEADGTLIVDAGDLLTPDHPGAIKAVQTPADVTARAAALARLEAQTGLAALAVGERELALGLTDLLKLAKAHKLRLLAANLVNARGDAVFEPGFVAEVAGVKVGVFGVTDLPEPQRAPLTAAGLVQQPVAPAATREVARLKAAGATVIVALAHTGVAGARELLKQVKGIDLAIAGHSSSSIADPERVGDGYVVEALRQGKQLGQFLLHVLPGEAPFVDANAARSASAQLAGARREYERVGRQLQHEPVDQRRVMLAGQLESVRGTFQRYCDQLKAAPPAPTGRWFQHELVPMDKRIADDPAVAAEIGKHNAELARAAAARGPTPPPGAAKTPLPPLKAPPAAAARAAKAAKAIGTAR